MWPDGAYVTVQILKEIEVCDGGRNNVDVQIQPQRVLLWRDNAGKYHLNGTQLFASQKKWQGYVAEGKVKVESSAV